MMASNNFCSWKDLLHAKEDIDLNHFFENSAYQNLFSELKDQRNLDIEDDDSTNAPDSRTVSGLSVLEHNKGFLLRKIEEEPKEKPKVLEINSKITKLLQSSVDDCMMERFESLNKFYDHGSN